MNLRTERLIIRTFQENDLNDVFEIYSDEKNCHFLLHEAWTEETKYEQIQKKKLKSKLTINSGLNLACQLDDKVIGDLSVWYTGLKETVEVGFVFNKSYAGKGYASEALRALIDHLFTVEKVHRIQANLDERNSPSDKLCQRVGMRKEAHFIASHFNKMEWVDCISYGMLESDFNNLSFS